MTISHADAAHCEALLREQDRDKWLACLFAPADRRPALFALHAFDSEISRVRDLVSEPLPGEIRLQWWRDVIDGQARGDAGAHPVAAALGEAIVEFGLPRQALANAVDARVRDLYDDPFETMEDLECYCGETSSAVIRLAAIILAHGSAEGPGSADAAGHAGVALGLTGLLRRFARLASRGQVFLPRSSLEAHGLTPQGILEGRASPGLEAVLTEVRRHVRRHLDAYRGFARGLPPATRPAFVATGLVKPYLASMDRPGYEPFRDPVDLAQWRRQWALWRESRRLS